MACSSRKIKRCDLFIQQASVNVEASLPILSELAWQAASLQCDE
jgi:hypothetical protein